MICHIFIRCAVLLSLLTLLSCTMVTSLNEPVCKSLDWYKLGLNLGQAGKFREDIGHYSFRCKQLKVAVDEGTYDDGYQAGLALYCQPLNIYNVAQRAQDFSYRGLCPEQDLEELSYAYELGQEYFESSKGLKALYSEDSYLETKEYLLEREIYDCESLTSKKCKDMLEDGRKEEIDSLESELSSVSWSRSRIAQKIKAEKDRLSDLEHEHLILLELAE